MTSIWKRITNRFRPQADPIQRARALGVRMGEGCRLYECDFGSEPYLITLGHHVTVTSGVQFITHDGGVWVFREEFPDMDVFAPIHVGNNVFIGLRAVIMPGVVIGDNCVIGAGSLVMGVIPSDSIVAGVPARVIRTLAEYREKTLKGAVHIRGLPPEQKRKLLCDKFGLTTTVSQPHQYGDPST